MRDHVEGRLRNARHYARYAQFWTDALGTKPLRQILPGDVARYVASRQQDGMAPATINRELAFLKRAFNVAIGDGLAETNPVKAIRLFKENNTRVRFLSDDEEARLRSAIGEGHWPKVAVALHTGLRRAEQFHLGWRCADFTTGIITVARSKSGETRRMPMNDTVREVLRALPSRLKSEWVFPSATDDTPLDAQNFVNRVFAPARKCAKLQGETSGGARNRTGDLGIMRPSL